MARKGCSCGSGLDYEDIYDARNIFLCRVCDKCREEKLARYRLDIFTDPNYWADEPIDPE